MTETEIANLALAHIGEARITDLNAQTVAAQHVRRMWTPTRERLLREHHWNFATRYGVPLARLSAAPAHTFAYAYQLPGDCLRVLTVNGIPAGTSRSTHSITGTQLLTNQSEAKIEYIANVVTCSEWDPSFVELFACELAAAIIPSFRLDPAAAAPLKQLAELARSRAMEADAVETKPRVSLPSDGCEYW